jgi:uncharacterized repeat protein (TIGR02543 family)
MRRVSVRPTWRTSVMSSMGRHILPEWGAINVARFSIFLIAAALIVGMAGCVPTQYNLTISSTNGGSVITPGEGTFTYNEGKVVRLVARSALGYGFVGWTGDVATITTVNSFSTTVTMNGDYSITANFGCGC